MTAFAPRLRAVALIGAGAVAVAVGVGLVPQVLENWPSLAAVVSILAIVGGIAALAAGLVSAASRWWGRVAAGAGAVVAVALATSVVAPGVAATNVPPSEVTTTPAEVGLDADVVALTTSDGVRLAGWYAPGTTGASVVLLHGAGSTRSAVVRHADVLHQHGFGVLMIDARGHGDSSGRAMDFGWYGDLDVAAGVDFLAERGQRVGVVGLSMGGEEAIGAAAADPRIVAVVAEGATGRTAADKAWLSDVHGWRGWIQEQIETAQYGLTDLLTGASPPTSLRQAVVEAGRTHFLLITAGRVMDERDAADHIASAAPDRATVWTVEGADHVGGLKVAPQEWEARVVAFLDQHLARTAPDPASEGPTRER